MNARKAHVAGGATAKARNAIMPTDSISMKGWQIFSDGSEPFPFFKTGLFHLDADLYLRDRDKFGSVPRRWTVVSTFRSRDGQ